MSTPAPAGGASSMIDDWFLARSIQHVSLCCRDAISSIMHRQQRSLAPHRSPAANDSRTLTQFDLKRRSLNSRPTWKTTQVGYVLCLLGEILYFCIFLGRNNEVG